MLFRDRVEAGRKLASALTKYRGLADVVLSIPTGGSVCGVEVANSLGLPHDLIFINKISHPHSPEYAVGAVNENGAVILKGEAAILDKKWLDEEIERQKNDIRRRRHIFLTNRSTIALRNKVVVIVDDMLGDDLSIRAAVEYVEKHKADKIIIAVPVARNETLANLKGVANDIFSLHVVMDDPFMDAGYYYFDHKKISDNEVVRIIETHKI